MRKVSVIICVYNEENTIKDVVQSSLTNLIVNEVIVVNDGSSDKSDKILLELNKDNSFKYVVLSKNYGKGYAMAVGVENATNEIIVFIDADLSNLISEHFFKLIMPIMHDEADMVLGQATETLINYNINPFKSFTGERSLLKEDIMPIIDKMKTSRFGVETLINLYYQSLGKTVKNVMLKDLEHPTKFDKTSSLNATKEFISEGHEIASTVIKNYDLVGKTLKRIINKNIKI